MERYASNVPPPRVSTTAGLTVRPDAARLNFVVSVAELPSDRALALLRAAVETIGRRLVSAVPTASVRMHGLALTAESRSKLSSAEVGQCRVEGEVEVVLGADETFWARAERVAATHAVLLGAAEQGRALKPPVAASVSSPVGVIREPERFRGELVKLWMARAHELCLAAPAGAVPLQVLDCAAPGAVQQRPVSLEAVELTLELAGRVDVPPAARDAAR